MSKYVEIGEDHRPEMIKAFNIDKSEREARIEARQKSPEIAGTIRPKVQKLIDLARKEHWAIEVTVNLESVEELSFTTEIFKSKDRPYPSLTPSCCYTNDELSNFPWEGGEEEAVLRLFDDRIAEVYAANEREADGMMEKDEKEAKASFEQLDEILAETPLPRAAAPVIEGKMKQFFKRLFAHRPTYKEKHDFGEQRIKWIEMKLKMLDEEEKQGSKYPASVWEKVYQAERDLKEMMEKLNIPWTD